MDANSADGGGRSRGKYRRRSWQHGGRSQPRHTRPREAAEGPVYGALDLGTNNCRLLLAVPAEGGFTVVDAFSRIVRLGEGISHSGRLSDHAMERTIEALRICANKLAWRSVNRFRLIATEACRSAENGEAFLARVLAETGLDLEIIDRETEAGLAVAGAAPLLADDAHTALVFDIGGGSTELMWLDMVPGQSGYVTREWTSLPAGVVTIAEKFGGADVTPQSFAAMRASLTPMLEEFRARIAARAGSTLPGHLLGTSGTVTTIAGVQLGLRRYDRSRVDGCWLAAEDIERVTADLLAMNYEERAQSPCIGRDRADLVLAGCAILEEIRAAFPATRLRVADRGLREGILTRLMVEDGTWGKTHHG